MGGSIVPLLRRILILFGADGQAIASVQPVDEIPIPAAT